jgi:hypothetical protein
MSAFVPVHAMETEQGRNQQNNAKGDINDIGTIK